MIPTNVRIQTRNPLHLALCRTHDHMEWSVCLPDMLCTLLPPVIQSRIQRLQLLSSQGSWSWNTVWLCYIPIPCIHQRWSLLNRLFLLWCLCFSLSTHHCNKNCLQDLKSWKVLCSSHPVWILIQKLNQVIRCLSKLLGCLYLWIHLICTPTAPTDFASCRSRKF